ncbi:YbiU family protein [Amphibiibacter pelophylacis]|uniref:YbiU family protein n=1 Tax=Amphibiibacter pelophylacis TaxID=1799477 RepID=UPI003BFA70BE
MATKRELKSRITDLPQRFAAMTARIEAQLEQIERERAAGQEPVPQIEFADLDRITEAQKAHIRQRGCLVVRNVFDDARVQRWNESLSEYLARNDYLAKLAKDGAVDNYFSTLASAKPQIYGVFWSQAQMEARTDPAMAQVHRFMNRLWQFESERGREFDPDQSLVYADRVRFRQPGDASLGLSAHVDSGSIERWVDPAYQQVYRHVFGGDLAQYDPFDAWQRTQVREIPSPAVCRMFRSFQAWTALTPQGPGDGTLQLLPVADAMAWMLLRALQDDVPEDELCFAAAGRAMTIVPQYHELLLRGYGSIPHMQAGDTVWWHPDVLHGVEDVHRGTGYSSVMYIAPAPDCAKNREYAAMQRPAFESGRSAPDFAPDDFETTFEGRCTPADLSDLGRKVMGYAG